MVPYITIRGDVLKVNGSTVSIDHVSKHFGDFHALDDVNFTIKQGEFFSLLGPSGCGKTTLLRIIAGFEFPDEGAVLFDGTDVVPLPPNKRQSNTIFQNYALFPHLSVYDNVAFPLKLKKLGKTEIDEKVSHYLHLVQLDEHAHKKPNQLSGGQRQRVAMGRSIVRNPKLFLFDEPLSNLDAKLRGATRREIMLLHKQLGATMLYVTHDQTEALTLADRIVCMSMGHVQQIGTPLELYDTPANIFVASFIGLPPMNLYDVKVEQGYLIGTKAQIKLTDEEADLLADYEGKKIVLGVRPENVADNGEIHVKVVDNENLGMNTLVHGYLGEDGKGPKIVAKLRGWCNYKSGDIAKVTFNRKHFFDQDTTAAIQKEA